MSWGLAAGQQLPKFRILDTCLLQRRVSGLLVGRGLRLRNFGNFILCPNARAGSSGRRCRVEHQIMRNAPKGAPWVCLMGCVT
jgi:hypothetical protein